MDPITIEEKGEKKMNKVSPRELFFKYLPFLPWIIASVVICLTLAYIKMRYAARIYSVTGTILVQDPNPYSSKTDKFDAILFSESNTNLNDEMQVIRSRNMAKRVARSLNLEVQYLNRGNVRSSLMYKGESPVQIKFIHLKDSLVPFSFPFTIENENEFKLTNDGVSYKFGQILQTAIGEFILTRTNVDLSSFATKEYNINYAPLTVRAEEIINNLSVSPGGESTNILQLRYDTENTNSGVDIVNQVMFEYQHAGLEEKRQVAVNALSFINDQMDTVRQDLVQVERNLETYRVKNKVYNPEQQTLNSFKTMSEMESQLTTLGAKLENVEFLVRALSNRSEPYKMVGSVLGIDEPSLVVQIQEFNALQVQRQTLLRSTTTSNPIVINIDATLEKLRVDMLQNLTNVKQVLRNNLNDLTARNNEMDREVSRIPMKEKQVLDITRRQKILEELYSYLLQKKLETSISSASTISNVRVLEPATSSGVPVKPEKATAYMTALFLGLLIPGTIIFLIEFFNDKVKSREDIVKITQAPIIGEVGHSENLNAIVVDKVSRKFIAEQFRIIRSNLQFVLPKDGKQVILVTSSSSGEGKSFISTNVGAVMALAGKRTAILELDIRKPKIMSSLNLPRRTGITNYIIGKSTIDEIIVNVPNIENLSIIPCGPVPPNPAELLLNEKMSNLFEELKERFDVLIIDTAPIGLVADATILSRFSDTTLYIIRHNYTFKKQLQLFDELYMKDRLPRISLVINDIKLGGGYGDYYGYGGYSFSGYTYGYGSDYFEDTEHKNSFLTKVMEIFRGKK